VRTRIIHSLAVALSPATAPYLLDQEVTEPDPQILSLNADLASYDETVSLYLSSPRELSFLRTGLGALINAYIVSRAATVAPINAKGSGRMQLNVLVLQQNLKNIEPGVDLARAANYFALLDKGADEIVRKAKEDAEGSGGGGDKEDGGEEADSTKGRRRRDPERFTYDELKVLVELCYSEQMADPERGVNGVAKRQMADKLLGLSEVMWQS
jgi:exocyst complex component 4